MEGDAKAHGDREALLAAAAREEASASVNDDPPRYQESPPFKEVGRHDTVVKADFNVASNKSDDADTVLTIHEAFDKIGYGWQQIRVVIICGLCFCTDSIEVGLLTFLQVAAKDEFGLSDVEESTLTAVVFAGELLGAVFWGPFADRCGRRRGSFFPASLVALAGVASAFSVNFYMLVTLRFLVGVGIGGMGVPFDLLAEFMPPTFRGKALLGIEFFWTFGTLFVNGLAWLTLSRLGWRYLVGLCSVPVVLAMLSFPLLPESPHWLLLMNRPDEALAVVRKAARLNDRADALPARARLVLSREPQPEDGKTYAIEDSTALLPNGTSDIDDDDMPTANEVSPLMLFDKTNRRTTLMLWAVWCASGFTYYGTVIIAPEFFSQHSNNSTTPANATHLHNNGTHHHNGTHHGGIGNEHFDYPALFTTGAAELLGCILAFLIIERVGRKIISGTGYLTSGVFMVLLTISVPRGLGIVMVMVCRATILIGTSVTWVMTPELYSTHVRAAGHSWCNAVARIGAFAAPYWGDASAIPFNIRLILFGVMNVVAAFSSFFIPKETRGMILD